ncbi:MAG TPA: replication initiator [Acidimicrobiales bacterium]|nr:replication initiator [Acidimicrobiales bacterium]
MSASLTLDEMEALARKRSANELIGIARPVDRTGGCAQPIRLRASGVDSPSRGEPDGVLLVACKTRRETRCAPCAQTYRGDARQLVRAGIEGGRGVPESVSNHPAVLLTLTAPSFGPVHRAGDGPCHIGPPGRCEHGRQRFCLQRHAEREDVVGSALCGECYDYEAAVMFNASAGELWRRVTIYARRHLAYAMGMPERELKELVRLSYLKVAELQRRGVVHLHAVVRVDSVGDEVAPPAVPVPTALLSEALLKAVRAVGLELEVSGRIIRICFGVQLKVEALERGAVKKIASYLANYAESPVMPSRDRRRPSSPCKCPELRAVHSA